MKIECIDIAARGRVVATLAEAKRQLDGQLGVKQHKMTILVLSDLIFDVFTFLRRKELDMLQAVNRRFNDVILRKMTLLCLRHIRHGEIEPSAKLNQYLLAFEGLLDAKLLESITRHGPTIVLDTFATENWKLPLGVSEDDLLYALQSFGELKCVHVVTLGDSADIFNFLFRNSFKINSSYVGSENNLVDGWWDAATAKDRLLEFSFGLCDKRYAARERTFRLRLKFLPPDFLKTWIQYAETVDCLHQLTLNVDYISEIQDLNGLHSYERHNESALDEGVLKKYTFESIIGRRWTAILVEHSHYDDSIHLKINH